MTNHTLEKPNDRWRLHLPLVIPKNLAQNPAITPKVDFAWVYDQDHWKKACTLLGCSMFATREAHYGFIQKFYDPCQWKMYPNGKGKDLSRTGCIFWYLRY